MAKIILIALILALTSCKEPKKREALDNYVGGVVYEKGWGFDPFLHIRIGAEIRFVSVYKLDYEKYEIGDTIK